MDRNPVSLPSASRRTFLRKGALVAGPVVAAALPAAAQGADESRARLARLEAERAIEGLHREFLRHLNGTGDGHALVTASDSVELGEGLRSITEDIRGELVLELSKESHAASARCTCQVEREVPFGGDTTVERMARFQGQGSHRRIEQRVLATEFIRTGEGWRISRATFA